MKATKSAKPLKPASSGKSRRKFMTTNLDSHLGDILERKLNLVRFELSDEAFFEIALAPEPPAGLLDHARERSTNVVTKIFVERVLKRKTTQYTFRREGVLDYKYNGSGISHDFTPEMIHYSRALSQVFKDYSDLNKETIGHTAIYTFYAEECGLGKHSDGARHNEVLCGSFGSSARLVFDNTATCQRFEITIPPGVAYRMCGNNFQTHWTHEVKPFDSERESITLRDFIEMM
jgi:hypothetical protein